MIRRVNTKNMILTAFFTALIAVGAFIKIPNPFFPVPFTLQGVFCALAGLLLGSKYGSLAVTVYIIMGLLGLPVFTAPAGPQYIFQPTFGFLLGFIATAYIIGKVSELNEEFTYTKAFASSYAGLFVQYALGISYMYVIYNFYNKSPIGFWALVSAMSLYFLKDIILYSVVASVSVVLRKSLSPILQER
ncbi:hypothetical protein Clst_0347 [Thermoclostridium stercorarium subsp. stercorarium DSM 8532]|jgi:biotin transport system substrate-specific component|nr:hypothetical protein Clst_0347 [Thermoclostridium stercorarium subsp. stercorarium DSM 8532]